MPRGSMKQHIQRNRIHLGRTSARVHAQHQEAIKAKQGKKTQLACKITDNIMSSIARQQKGKGDSFSQEAEACLNKKSWFTSKEKKCEDAAELFDKSGNAYKVGGFYYEAGAAYTKGAIILRDDLKNNFDASKAFQNAATNFKKSDPQKAMEAYNAAIMLMTDAGRVLQAAKLSKECAQVYENEELDGEEKSHIVLAIEMYQQSADFFTAEDSHSQANQCWAKVAELCSASLDPPDLIRAARLYDELGQKCLASNLLKFNAKGYFLQSIICHLANGDAIAAQQRKDQYEGMDYTLSSAREGKFASHLIECVEGYDTEGFATACMDYDRISKLDPWKTSMLVKVKRTINDDDGDEEEDDVDLT